MTKTGLTNFLQATDLSYLFWRPGIADAEHARDLAIRSRRFGQLKAFGRQAVGLKRSPSEARAELGSARQEAKD